jgi:hypothetical protein
VLRVVSQVSAHTTWTNVEITRTAMEYSSTAVLFTQVANERILAVKRLGVVMTNQRVIVKVS